MSKRLRGLDRIHKEEKEWVCTHLHCLQTKAELPQRSVSLAEPSSFQKQGRDFWASAL